MAKNIVLFSDGTGNSSAKLFKTNVWRLYQALDLTGDHQIAVYDDGVGTSSLKALAMLGGVFGWGLKRNVLDLYRFLCRHYVRAPILRTIRAPAGKDCDQDRIYAFGFSRGAFTIRVLVGLIDSEGLVTFGTEAELRRNAIAAYRAYRKKHYSTIFRHEIAVRWVRDELLAAWDRFVSRTPYAKVERRKNIPIRFLGLWDTVDAYGIPIHELKQGIDRYIWPLSLPDMKLSKWVERACHALSLDDERTTFHPLVWNEMEEAAKVRNGEVKVANRLIQVWFAGMHANVGGGYFDDSLAFVPLAWIMKEAKAAQLAFIEREFKAIQDSGSAFGKIYDSRADVGTFYRYDPRRIDVPRAAKGNPLLRPKVHESVVFRMAAGFDGYAPLTVPDVAQILAEDGSVTPFSGFQNELRKRKVGLIKPDRAGAGVGTKAEQSIAELVAKLAEPTPDLVNLVWDTVWWRRVTYFLTMLLAVLLAAFPWLVPESGIGVDPWGVERKSAGLTDQVFDAIEGLVPGFAATWIRAFKEHPVVFLVLLLLFAGVYQWSGFLQRRIRDRARAAWNIPPRSDRGGFLKESMERWRNVTIALVGIAGIALAASLLANTGAVAKTGSALVFTAFLVLFLWRRSFDSKRMATAPHGEERAAESPGLGLRFARFMRTNTWTKSAHRWIANRIVPFAFALAVVATVVFALNRLAFEVWSSAGYVCTGTADPPRVNQKTPATVTFPTKAACFATGYQMEAGAKYRIEFAVREPWADAGIEDGVGPKGFGSFHPQTPWLMPLFVPLRRAFTEAWFAPLARIDSVGKEEYALGPNSTLIEPQRSGELFLYVNDAVIGWPGAWAPFYDNNSGTTEITIRKVDPPAKY
jgi:uncharacterized protein (DUF2235 family)